MLYRSKQVVIEAQQLSKDNVDELAQWCDGRVISEIDAQDENIRFVGINIQTLEGVMRASEGDWIIKGTVGEFYPCKPGVFQNKYEPA